MTNPPIQVSPLDRKVSSVTAKIIEAFDSTSKGYFYRDEVYNLFWEAFKETGMSVYQITQINNLIDVMDERFSDGKIPSGLIAHMLKPMVELHLSQLDER